MSELRPGDFEWLAPWRPIVAGEEGLARELACEVSNGHPLYGVRAQAVARRDNNDDVLFELSNYEYPLAVVHLAWAGRERNPEWPETAFYTSWEDWIERRMKTDQ